MDAILYILLAIFAIVAVVSLYNFHRSEQYKHFNLLDIITCQKGVISRPACMEIGAWCISTWGFIVLVSRDGLTEWYMGAYIGAFVLRGSWSAYLGSKTGEQPRA